MQLLSNVLQRLLFYVRAILHSLLPISAALTFQKNTWKVWKTYVKKAFISSETKKEKAYLLSIIFLTKEDFVMVYKVK